MDSGGGPINVSVRIARRGSIAASTGSAPAGPFEPENIVGAVEVWVADDLALADADPVSSWTGRIAGSSLAQSGGKRPVYDLDGIGGQPSVNFDGTDDVLRYAGTLTTGLSGHVFIVAYAAISAIRVAWATSDEASGAHFLLGAYQANPSGTVWFDNYEGGEDFLTAVPTLGVTTPMLLEWASTGTAYEFRENNSVRALTVGAGADSGDWFGDFTARDNFTVGAWKQTAEYFFWNGRIAAVIVVDGTISADDRAALNAGGAGKYGITLA